MSKEDMDMTGKPVKDLYGTSIGKVVGTITDIEGTIQTVGVDCGWKGLEQIPYEHLVFQNDVVIYIPEWRLEAQRLLREKGLTLSRMKALLDIEAANDEMKEDAGLINEKYKEKLHSIEEKEKKVIEQLDARRKELEEKVKSIMVLVFDAKVQYKSNETSEGRYESVKVQAAAMMEPIEHEKSEISNIERRIEDLSLESVAPPQTTKEKIQNSAVSYLNQEPTTDSTP
ncbi:MAG: CdvA-like protein, partial [Nitrosopumilaceae archaeon]